MRLLPLLFAFGLLAQMPKPDPRMIAETQADHADMLQQLGIVRLRPGPSGDPKSPNSANYDESKANPYPKLPEILVLKNGNKVTSAKLWTQRRAEILEDFEREVIGRVPKGVPGVTWELKQRTETTIGGRPVIAKELVGHVDNSSYPDISVDIDMTLITPADAKGKVPVVIMFGFGRFALPPAAGAAAPRFGPYAPVGSDAPPAQQLIEAGWGFAMLTPTSIQADNGAGLTKGIIGLVNKGQRRKPEDWGALRAWAWGASRALDYFETDAAVDAKRVAIDGVSRYGKAALVTMAVDPRFAAALVASSGEGGVKLHRRNFGEAVENLTGSGEYHWMAGNFLKYGADEGKFGRKDANDIPVDAHQLLALCAPRAVYVSYGIPEKGDANWLDQRGSWMATVAAGKVWRLLGAKDLGVGDDYLNTPMPAVNLALLDGQLGWRQHDGGHTDGPSWKHFIPWANKMLR